MSYAERVRVLPQRTMRKVFISLSHQEALARMAVRHPITRPMVARFVAGESLAEALPAIEELHRGGLGTTVDVLGESVTSTEQAAAAVDRYLDTIAALVEHGLDVNVSLKLTQMGLDIDRDTCRANVMRIVDAAAAAGGFVRIDMEDHLRTDATIDVWREAHDRCPNVGIVLQTALRRTASDLAAVTAAGGRIRLCKGAYDEPPSVAYRTKSAVDRNYLRLMERLLLADAHPAIATHDPRIIAEAIAITERERIDADHFEFQMLYGIRRDLQRSLAERGYQVRIYVPYGTEWYPYFMRRLAERPANVAFMLRSLAHEETRRIRVR